MNALEIKTSTKALWVLREVGAYVVFIEMDGRGRCHDNIFIERLWRSLKWELIYLREFEDGQALKQQVKQWFHWYNRQRLHQALGYQTPDEVFYKEVTI